MINQMQNFTIREAMKLISKTGLEGMLQAFK